MNLRRNLDIYMYNTRRKCDYHVPSCNAVLFKLSLGRELDCTTKYGLEYSN